MGQVTQVQPSLAMRPVATDLPIQARRKNWMMTKTLELIPFLPRWPAYMAVGQ